MPLLFSAQHINPQNSTKDVCPEISWCEYTHLLEPGLKQTAQTNKSNIFVPLLYQKILLLIKQVPLHT